MPGMAKRRTKALHLELGCKAVDTITGFTGIAVCFTRWLTGCDRWTLQPVGLDKDGKTRDQQTFDGPLLRVLAPPAAQLKAASSGSTAKGGPRPEPVRRKDPR